jgi:hypothetical protein
MGLFKSAKKANNVKAINMYIKERIKEKRALNEQITKLIEQFQSEEIDEYTYERLRDVLEINDLQQRDEALEKTIFSK